MKEEENKNEKCLWDYPWTTDNGRAYGKVIEIIVQDRMNEEIKPRWCCCFWKYQSSTWLRLNIYKLLRLLNTFGYALLYIVSNSNFAKILRMKTECVHFSLEMYCLLCGKRANFQQNEIYLHEILKRTCIEGFFFFVRLHC